MGRIEYYTLLAKEGTKESIANIMNDLNMNTTIADTRFIDFGLSHVESDEGFKTMKYYLFYGTQIQRNYSALYFGRLDEYLIIQEAYNKGLIDYKQAFSR